MAQDNIDPYLVQFAPDDKENPKNWSRRRRWYLTYFAGLLGFNATFASSAPSGIATQLMAQFKLSEEVAALTISLFVAGYCVGPLFWGPLSEQVGQLSSWNKIFLTRVIFLVTFPVYVCFQVGCALSKNTASIIVFRLLGGLFAAAPLTNSGALISDIWDAKTRGKALALFTLAPFVGPALGPLVGGYIAQSGTPWPWLFWVLTIFAAVCFVLIYFTLPETYAPIVLLHRAKQLRLETGDERYHAPLELVQQKQLHKRLEDSLARPFKILICEPMLIAVTAYMSFVYGCVYLLFEAYPVVFTGGHTFSARYFATFRTQIVFIFALGDLGLTYLPLVAGSILGVFGYLLIFHPQYEAAMDRHKAGLVSPEIRLNLAMSGAPLFAITFFWFGWTSYPSISYWAPMMAGALMGLSSIWIFVRTFFHFCIDVYLIAAASALAANTVFRSAAGAVFPLFASQMYTALDPRWASTLLGCIACMMIPIPIVLKRYGPTLRARSRFAPALV
ncbi:MFS general substrate transporter [Suillus subalutaceus]|uniref:MFS general substrate transporter n=1 Tax=Suillus subalutaceus TaxID=48586 RepID=UPI001B8843A5|nr:MFS general substrate transporter [Suillus subalutaceus]KAG1841538.1 MFS general substrate transporter [Suillus subalutaceus]